jgi:hypothetical protein
VAAIDELEGMWTSYILCPDAGDDSRGGAAVGAAETRGYSGTCPDDEVDLHVSGKTADEDEGTAQETISGSCVGVEEVEISVSDDNISKGGDWLTTALRQRAELQECERSQQGCER